MPSNESLSARIAERAAIKKTSLFAQNRASFMALTDDIKLAINDGWAIKNIWDLLAEEGKITFSYPTFNNYVKKLISNTIPIKTSVDEVVSNNIEEQKAVEKTPGHPAFNESKKPEENNSHQSLLKGLPGFDFGKTLSKEDLI